MKLSKLAELVERRERELAYGSETILLGDFVQTYGYVNSALESDKEIPNHEYMAWETAYNRMEKWDNEGHNYNAEDLFD